MRTIFIVDDQEVNLLLAKTALDGLYRTFALPSIERMFKLAERVIPDLILLDVEMPDINGYEAIKLIKNDEKLKFIPVIFLTAKNDAESELKGFETGALDFIYKPFSAPVLLKRVGTHIEMDKLVKTIQKKNNELMEMHESKNNILAMVSHDLKNYVGGIQQAIEVINVKYNSFDNNKFIKMIDDLSIKAFLLVKDILAINKFEAELDEIAFTLYDINKLIKECNENLKLVAKEKKINMTFELLDEPVFCMLSPEKIQRALDNLCINAIKFTEPNGSITVRVQKSHKKDNSSDLSDTVEIHIIDTGIGIEKEMLNKLFEKFTKAGRTGTAGEASTGLGLYIVKQIVEQHGGAIEVSSVVGEGSEFIIKLPINPSQN